MSVILTLMGTCREGLKNQTHLFIVYLLPTWHVNKLDSLAKTYMSNI